jgi:hypothetical protein
MAKKNITLSKRDAVRKAEAKKKGARKSAAGKSVTVVSDTRIAREGWFWVSAIYRSERPESASTKGPHKGGKYLWERRVFVFKAPLGQERRAARRLAKQHEHKYKNVYGETVHWHLKEIEGYAELFDKRIVSGTEVYWTFFERE